MRNIAITRLLVLALVLQAGVFVSAQNCIVNVTAQSPGAYPSDTLDSLDNVTHPIQVVQMAELADTVIFGMLIEFDSLHVDSVSNLPAGMSWSCHSTGQSCLVLQDSTHLFHFCIQLEVDQNAQAMQPGQYDTVVVHMTSFITIGFTGLQRVPSRRVLYYRINGPIQALEDPLLRDELSTFQLSPNPTRANVRLEGSLASNAVVTVEVCDMLGRTLSRQNLGLQPPGMQSLELELGDLKAGVYWAVLTVGDARRAFRFIRVD